VILDGIHRLMEAHDYRLEEVSVHRVPRKHLIQIGRKS
jgi:hypothetical protein